MSRRGQAEMLEWFPRLIMMLLAVIIIAMLVRYFSQHDFDSPSVHRTSYAYRMYYDDDLLAAHDSVTGRTYPGTIDLSRFTDEYLSTTYPPTGKIASKLTLDGSCVPGKDKSVTIYHDEQTYTAFIGLARFGTLGPGGATMDERTLPVTIIGEKERCYGTLNMTIVRSNS